MGVFGLHRSFLLAGALLFASISAPSNAATTLINGSFESGSPSPGLAHIAANDAVINGWKIGGAGVDYVSSYWQASDGTRSLRLAGSGISSISQSFATEAGTFYAIIFDMSADPAGGIGLNQMLVSIDGAQDSLVTYDVTSANSRNNMLWQTYAYTFTATGALSTLTFASIAPEAYGPALDNVVLLDSDTVPSPIPEPMSWALMGAGFAVIGMVRRRAGRRSYAVGNT